METSESINELSAALAKAQGAFKGAIKDTANDFFKAKYADLSSVWEACRKPLSENGLAVIQTTGINPEQPDHVMIETRLCHSSGQWVSGKIVMKPTKTDPQGIGSCITYARRYALSAMVGIAPEDDDGNAASGKNETDKIDRSLAIETWRKHIYSLYETSSLEDFRAFWPATKDEITHDCTQAGAAWIYKYFVELGKKKAEEKVPE